MKRILLTLFISLTLVACGWSMHAKRTPDNSVKKEAQIQTVMIYLITEAQKDLLVGQEYTPGGVFNPVQDCNGNWLITQEEIDQLTNEEFAWIRDLTPSEYCPPEEQP